MVSSMNSAKKFVEAMASGQTVSEAATNINKCNYINKNNPNFDTEYLEILRDMEAARNTNRYNQKFYKWCLENLTPMVCALYEELSDCEVRILTAIINIIRRNLGSNSFPIQSECYYNAYMISHLSNGLIEYCEGWYTCIIGIEHAWCRFKESGRYFDPTVMFNSSNGFEDIEYFGILLSDDERDKHCLRHSKDGAPTIGYSIQRLYHDKMGIKAPKWVKRGL